MATGTIVFGLALLFAAFGTLFILAQLHSAGLSFGFIAYLVAILVAIPTVRRVDRIACQAITEPPGPPPLEPPKLLRRADMAFA